MPEPSPHKALGEPFIELDKVGSTNNYALAQIHAGMASHGMAFFAWEQYAGKGQRGKTWLSEKGNNLIVSLIIQPGPLLLQQQFQLSACLAIGVANWFETYAGDATRIKWPNDLYWHDRKAGGILVESVIGQHDGNSASWKWAVAGIGININQVQFDESLKNPVSLRQITGKTFQANLLARELCRQIDRCFQDWKTKGWAQILDRYNQLLFRQGEISSFRQGNRRFDARIKEVDEHGRLVLSGEIDTIFEFGTLEWII